MQRLIGRKADGRQARTGRPACFGTRVLSPAFGVEATDPASRGPVGLRRSVILDVRGRVLHPVPTSTISERRLRDRALFLFRYFHVLTALCSSLSHDEGLAFYSPSFVSLAGLK